MNVEEIENMMLYDGDILLSVEDAKIVSGGAFTVVPGEKKEKRSANRCNYILVCIIYLYIFTGTFVT